MGNNAMNILFNFFGEVGGYGVTGPFFKVPREGVFVIAVLIAWSLAWKGLALWRASHREEKGWFIALLVLNTVGILDILYLYVFSKKKEDGVKVEEVKS